MIPERAIQTAQIREARHDSGGVAGSEGKLASRPFVWLPGVLDRPTSVSWHCHGLWVSAQAGILTAIVGGLVVSRINGSFMTICGPAAGLIVVILNSVRELGEGDALAGYHYTLAAIVFASLAQIALGYFKAGKLSAFFRLMPFMAC